jgi:hypothetical protein
MFGVGQTPEDGPLRVETCSIQQPQSKTNIDAMVSILFYYYYYY